MTNTSTCPYCSYPIGGESVTLWDGRVYCGKCVEGVSPKLYQRAVSGAPLEETVTREEVRAWRYFRHWYRWYAIFVLATFGSLCAVAVSRGASPFIPVVIFTLVFACGIWHRWWTSYSGRDQDLDSR